MYAVHPTPGVNIIVVGSIFCPPSFQRLNILPHKKTFPPLILANFD